MGKRADNPWLEPFRFTWAVLIGLPRAMYWVVRGYFDQLEPKTAGMVIALGVVAIACGGIFWYAQPESVGPVMLQYVLPGSVMILFATLFVFGLVSLHARLKERRSGLAKIIEVFSGIVCAVFAGALVFVFFMLGQAGLSGISEAATGKRVVSITVFRPGNVETFKPEEYAIRTAGVVAGLTFLTVLGLVFSVKPDELMEDEDEDRPKKRRKRRRIREDDE